jgi:hypothetical protein
MHYSLTPIGEVTQNENAKSQENSDLFRQESSVEIRLLRFFWHFFPTHLGLIIDIKQQINCFFLFTKFMCSFPQAVDAKIVFNGMFLPDTFVFRQVDETEVMFSIRQIDRHLTAGGFLYFNGLSKQCAIHPDLHFAIMVVTFHNPDKFKGCGEFGGLARSKG